MIMDRKSLSDYFCAAAGLDAASKGISEEVQLVLARVEGRVGSKVRMGWIGKGKKRKDLRERGEVEAAIKRKKLEHAVKDKKALQTKLKEVDRQIEELGARDAAGLLNEKNVSQIRFEEDRAKALAFVQEVKKFSSLRQQSENNFKLQSEKLKRKVKRLEQQDLVSAEKTKELREKTRLQEIVKLRQKREERQTDVLSMKSSQTTSPSYIREKPLFLRLQEHFKTIVEMPELERRKDQLKQKSVVFAPIRQLNLKHHEDWYLKQKELSSLKLNQSRKPKNTADSRSSSVNLNSWALRLMEEDKKAEEERLRKKEDKRKRLERKARYSELIQELHAPFESTPSISPASFSKVEKKIRTSESVKKLNDCASIDSKIWKPHVFPPNRMIPQPRACREAKQVNYLENKRKDGWELSNEDKLKEILKESIEGGLDGKDLKEVQRAAFGLERIARKRELAAETKPLSISSINQSKSADKLLITSIKAKIKVLEKM